MGDDVCFCNEMSEYDLSQRKARDEERAARVEKTYAKVNELLERAESKAETVTEILAVADAYRGTIFI